MKWKFLDQEVGLKYKKRIKNLGAGRASSDPLAEPRLRQELGEDHCE